MTGGDALTFPASGRFWSQSLRERLEGWLPAYMAGSADRQTRRCTMPMDASEIERLIKAPASPTPR